MTDSRKRLICRLGLIVLLTVAAYGACLTNGFVWDDAFIIVNNPLLEKLGNIPRFFLTEDTIVESTGYYRPVTYISFALERGLWGTNPAGYHLTNLVLHLCAALLLYAVTAALFNKERLALIAALIFALHPVAGETVNFLAGGRNTLLSACGALLAMLCYLEKKPLAAVAGFTVATFSKEFALLLPMMFLLHDYRRQREQIRFRRYLPYLIVIAVYLALRALAVRKANFLAAINLADVVTAPYYVVRYGLNMLFPVRLKVLYDVHPGLVAGACSLVLLLVMAAALYRFRKHDETVLSAGWFLLFLLPVINVIPLHTTTQMADRYAYFSLMGFALLLASAICRGSSRAVTVGVMVLCALYGVIDLRHTAIWKNDVTFFTRMTHDAPNRFAGFENLGMRYFREGNIPRAEQNLAAADARPDITVKYLVGNAYVLWKEEAPDQAEEALVRASALEPYNPEPYMVLAMMSAQRGDRALASSYRARARALVNGIDEIMAAKAVELCRSGEAYMSSGEYVDAELVLWQALQINPGYVPALVDIGSLSAETGNPEKAALYLGKAVALDPSNAPAHHNLAMVYRMLGREADARRELMKYREAGAAGPGGGASAPR